MSKRISDTIEQQMSLHELILSTRQEQLKEIADGLISAFHQDGRLFLAGSGPFGAIASLLGQSFIHRQTLERPALPAIALSNDAGLASFLAADNQSAQLFSRQLRALATPKDILLILAGAEVAAADRDVLETARNLGCTTILIAGEKAGADIAADISLRIPSDVTPRLLECTLLIGNLLCALVEESLFGI